MHLGPRAILAVLAVKFQPGLTTARIEAAVDRLHARVKLATGGLTQARLIVIEPAGGASAAFGAAPFDGPRAASSK
jgi:hypothetical protein